MWLLGAAASQASVAVLLGSLRGMRQNQLQGTSRMGRHERQEGRAPEKAWEAQGSLRMGSQTHMLRRLVKRVFALPWSSCG